MKKLALLALTTLGLSACDLNLYGTLLLQQTMVVMNSQGQTQALAAGSYDADIKIQDKKITVKMPSLSSELVIKMTKDQRKSLEKGHDTVLPSKTSGQPFDVLAKITSRTLDKRTSSTTQTCTRYESRTVCTGSGSTRVCWTESYPVMGWQSVRIVEEDVQSFGNMKIFKTGTQELLSTASAETKVHTYTYTVAESACF